MNEEQTLKLGPFEETVLLAILNLGNNAYGVTIRQKVEAVTGRASSFGAIYVTLDRLSEKGYISSRMGEATPERGGRAKKYFKVEGTGMNALEEAQRRRMSLGIGNLGLQS